MAPEHFERDTGEVLPTVYVRGIAAAEVFDRAPQGAAIEVDGVRLDPAQTLYAIHDEDGRRVGLFADREAAFAAARWHGAEPVSVH